MLAVWDFHIVVLAEVEQVEVLVTAVVVIVIFFRISGIISF